MDVVESNPVTGTARPGVEKRRDRVLTHDEIRQFWTACEKLPAEMAAAWKLRLLTAQRANEVHDLTRDDTRPDRRLVDAAGRAQPRTRSSHRVPLSAPALAILTALRAKEDSAC